MMQFTRTRCKDGGLPGDGRQLQKPRSKLEVYMLSRNLFAREDKRHDREVGSASTATAAGATIFPSATTTSFGLAVRYFLACNRHGEPIAN